MTGPERAASALAEPLGRGLILLAATPWHSVTFDGLQMLIEADADLPANVGLIDFDVPGYIVADIAPVTARRAEVLLIGAA